MLKGHGSDSHYYPNIRADFSSNVLWVDYSSEILPTIAKNIKELQRYPDVEYSELIDALAQSYGLSSDHLMATNGAVAGIYQVAQAFAGSQSHLFYPEFAEYECSLQMFQHKVAYSRFADFSRVSKNANFLMLGNPNNPTGALIEKSKICQFLSDRKDITVVVDESYMEFVSPSQSMIQEIGNFPNLVVIKSFTKRYSIPGLRLGYIVAQPAMIDRLNEWTQPWSVNALASKVGVEIVNHPEKFHLDWEAHFQEKERFYQSLCKISELSVMASASHYFLIELKSTTAESLKDYLVSHHGLLIRNASNFRGLNDRFFRVASRSPDENDLLISALKSYFSKNREGMYD